MPPNALTAGASRRVGPLNQRNSGPQSLTMRGGLFRAGLTYSAGYAV